MGRVLAALLLLTGAVRAETLPPPEETAPLTDPAVALADWTATIRARALAEGISPATLEAALADLRWLPDVVERDRRQTEFTRTIWDYLDTAVSDDRIAAGLRAIERHGATLAAVEVRYGVDRHIVAAIWGLESAYGAVRGEIPTLSALATLAADGRRGAFFSDQFLAALRIVDAGHVTPDRMVGSWAGAMGHTQFMPSSFAAHAVDFDGDGRRDIWGDDPADALASTAAYLASYGWVPGQPWGVEVTLPEGFDYSLARDTNRQSVAIWTALGVRGTDGNPVPDHGAAVILLPGGADGAAFMTFRNFTVLERYNTADAYVVAVGHLADRLAGGPPLVADWPRHERALTLEERLELQRRLTAAGFDTQGVDGRIGPRTVGAIRAWQRANGRTPDGFPSLSILQALR